MLTSNSLIFIDTNVIIEAFRVNCWNLISGYFSLNTVVRCVEEINTGNRGQSNNIFIDTNVLISRISSYQITTVQLVHLEFRLNGNPDLDPGEKELLAYVLSQSQVENVYFLCSPDRAFINAVAKVNLLDRVVSLEEMTKAAGGNFTLRKNFTELWLKNEKTRLIMGSV